MPTNNQVDLTCVELVRSFMEYASSQGIESFPPLIYGSAWHELFYQLRENFPELAHCIGKFDWDGSYPKNRQLKDFGSSAGYAFFGRTRPDDDRLILIRQREKNLLAKKYPLLAEKIFAFTNQIPGFFENPQNL